MRPAVATAGGALATAFLFVVVAAGCGTAGLAENASAGAGKDVFVARCGSCHTLGDAGTQGTIGPNLDNAFVQARRDGLGDSTIREVVHQQIYYSVQNPPTANPGMPGPDETLPECGEGQQPGGDGKDFCVADQAEAAAAIATYVAGVAGVEGGGGATTGGATTAAGGGGGAADGEAVFASAGCGSCHTLAAAGSSGTIGPNLDDSKPSKDLAVDRVTNGKGAMPPFAGQLSDAEIQAVAEFVSSSAGG